MSARERPARAQVASPAGLVRKLRRLRAYHVVTAARVLAWLAIAKILLATRGFAAVRRMLGLVSVEPAELPRGTAPVLDAHTERSVLTALALLDRPILRATCLPHSIVIERLLATHGVKGDLVIGVDTAQGFRAHAWVELNGNPVGTNESGSAFWKALARFRRKG